MWYIVIGLFFIIGGASGHLLKGTNRNTILVVLGVIWVGYGISKLLSKKQNSDKESDEEDCTVIDENMLVYNQSDELSGILQELSPGSQFLLKQQDDFNRFYQIQLPNGTTGYILKTSKFSKSPQFTNDQIFLNPQNEVVTEEVEEQNEPVDENEIQEQESNKCPGCGQQIDENTVECPECGLRLKF